MINQIRCLGVLATIEARQKAYPNRYEFKDFYQIFWQCVSGGESFRVAKAKYGEKTQTPIWKELSMQIRTAFRDEFPEWKDQDEAYRENETDKLVTPGKSVMFLMQTGEKKLREFMASKTRDQMNAITYMVNCYKNKGWKKATIPGIR